MSSSEAGGPGDRSQERAVIGRGFHNGVVAVARRWLVSGAAGGLSGLD